MRYRIAVIASLTGFVLTGCASEQSATVENQVKIIEYEKCLLLQQDALNTINNQMAQDESFLSLVRILDRQAGSEGKFRFDLHLKNCERYRP
jgi:hypothetical protein